jgi:hypothetical protein
MTTLFQGALSTTSVAHNNKALPFNLNPQGFIFEFFGTGQKKARNKDRPKKWGKHLTGE